MRRQSQKPGNPHKIILIQSPRRIQSERRTVRPRPSWTTDSAAPARSRPVPGELTLKLTNQTPNPWHMAMPGVPAGLPGKASANRPICWSWAETGVLEKEGDAVRDLEHRDADFRRKLWRAENSMISAPDDVHILSSTLILGQPTKDDHNPTMEGCIREGVETTRRQGGRYGCLKPEPGAH